MVVGCTARLSTSLLTFAKGVCSTLRSVKNKVRGGGDAPLRGSTTGCIDLRSLAASLTLKKAKDHAVCKKYPEHTSDTLPVSIMTIKKGCCDGVAPVWIAVYMQILLYHFKCGTLNELVSQSDPKLFDQKDLDQIMQLVVFPDSSELYGSIGFVVSRMRLICNALLLEQEASNGVWRKNKNVKKEFDFKNATYEQIKIVLKHFCVDLSEYKELETLSSFELVKKEKGFSNTLSLRRGNFDPDQYNLAITDEILDDRNPDFVLRGSNVAISGEPNTVKIYRKASGDFVAFTFDVTGKVFFKQDLARGLFENNPILFNRLNNGGNYLRLHEEREIRDIVIRELKYTLYSESFCEKFEEVTKPTIVCTYDKDSGDSVYSIIDSDVGAVMDHIPFFENLTHRKLVEAFASGTTVGIQIDACFDGEKSEGVNKLKAVLKSSVGNVIDAIQPKLSDEDSRAFRSLFSQNNDAFDVEATLLWEALEEAEKEFGKENLLFFLMGYFGAVTEEFYGGAELIVNAEGVAPDVELFPVANNRVKNDTLRFVVYSGCLDDFFRKIHSAPAIKEALKHDRRALAVYNALLTMTNVSRDYHRLCGEYKQAEFELREAIRSQNKEAEARAKEKRLKDAKTMLEGKLKLAQLRLGDVRNEAFNSPADFLNELRRIYEASDTGLEQCIPSVKKLTPNVLNEGFSRWFFANKTLDKDYEKLVIEVDRGPSGTDRGLVTGNREGVVEFEYNNPVSNRKENLKYKIVSEQSRDGKIISYKTNKREPQESEILFLERV